MRKQEPDRLPLILLAATAAVVLFACVVASQGVGGVSASERNAPLPAALQAAPGGAAVTFSAVGDSITEVDSPDFAAGDLGPNSWVTFARGDALTFAGGWADGGATTEAMAANASPVASDVLVIMAGTNDLGKGIKFAETAANLQSIATTVGVPRVVLCAIPPNDSRPDDAAGMNASLQQLAADQGWEWLDPAAALRAAGNVYAAGLSSDGTHPTADGERLIGQAVRDYLLAG